MAGEKAHDSTADSGIDLLDSGSNEWTFGTTLVGGVHYPTFVLAGVNDGVVDPIGSLSGAINTHDADVHIHPLSHFVFKKGTTYTLASDAAVGATSLVLTSVVGLLVGDYLHITDTSNNNHEHCMPVVTNIAVNTITLDRPLDRIFLAATTTVDKVLINLGVAGTLASPQIYVLQPDPGSTWHVTSMSFTILDNAAMDDNTFGGLASLTNGVVFRVKDILSGTYTTLFKWKNNTSPVLDGFTTAYNARAPSGYYGYTGQIDGRNVYGAIFRLANTLTETSQLEILIQDDLSGLVDFKVKLQGHTESS